MLETGIRNGLKATKTWVLFIFCVMLWKNHQSIAKIIAKIKEKPKPKILIFGLFSGTLYNWILHVPPLKVMSSYKCILLHCI